MSIEIQSPEAIPSSDWILQPQKGSFTHNDLIDAYLQGKEEQRDEHQRIMTKALHDNVIAAQKVVEEIVDLIVAAGTESIKAYLRISTVSKYDAIFDVSSKDYISDKFDEIYRHSNEIKKRVNSDTFNINITFMPHTGSLNEKRITCDGFFYSYEKRE